MAGFSWENKEKVQGKGFEPMERFNKTVSHKKIKKI
jgi:hypothetical protein